jgi:hypothetical protein
MRYSSLLVSLLAILVAYRLTPCCQMSSVAVPAITPTLAPLSFVLLGATGRTGLPFLAQSLARGHRVTALMRTVGKLPPSLADHPNLTAVQAELADSDEIERAIFAAKPDVVYSMLASDPPPHTAVSTGAHSVFRALRTLHAKQVQAAGDALVKPTPFVTIAGWGLEGTPTENLPRRWYERGVMAIGRMLYKAPIADFKLMFQRCEAAKADGIVRPIVLMPPLLTNGPRTTTFQYGDWSKFTGVMRALDQISREDLAHAALELGEQAAAGEEVPEWVAIRQP